MEELFAEESQLDKTDISAKILNKGMYHRLFQKHHIIVPQLSEVYELALAYYEGIILSDKELIRSGAYFSRIGGEFTHHFLMCTGDPVLLPDHSSSRLKSFFSNNQFRTGYATHGLFPYRGKFHPQMIKALINIMGLKPGNTILDPMMGSGTVLIEASLMGIKSIGFDASPFCEFMARTKYDALSLSQTPLNRAEKNFEQIFDFFTKFAGKPILGSKKKETSIKSKIQEAQIDFPAANLKELMDIIKTDDVNAVNFLLLAYLDSAGYSERSKRKSPLLQFKSILERYVFVVKKINRVVKFLEIQPAETMISKGDARTMSIENCSVDGILFSPPYSFAINYLLNDSFHLNFFGEDIGELQKDMVGLRGKNIKEKYALYIKDMERILSECARVLKPECFCTIIVGTNDNQLSKALGVPKNQVIGLHKTVINLASRYGFSLTRLLSRRISGIANTMRNEFIVILRKNQVLPIAGR